MEIVNMTPHAIVVQNGEETLVFEPSGTTVRMDTVDSALTPVNGIPTVTTRIVDHNLPDPVDGVCLLVSAMVLSSFPNRKDLIAPNTGKATRNEKGHIVSVPGFVTNA